MIKYLFTKVLIFCIIYVNCEDYDEINNSISENSNDNSDVNNVFDSAEYLDMRDNELERNDTEYKRKFVDYEIRRKAALQVKKDIPCMRTTTARSVVTNMPTTVRSLPIVYKRVEQIFNNDYEKELFKVPENITSTKKHAMSVSKQSEEKKSSEEYACKKNAVVNFPFIVSIQRKGSHYATGALLNNQTVITVAADFFNVRESIKLFKVRLGSVDCKKGGILLPIKKISIHPYFAKGNPSYDVALIKLSTPVPYSDFIKPIPLSNVTQKVLSAKFMTAYWPRLIVNGHSLPKTAKERVKHNSMRVSTQKLLPWNTCSTFIEGTDVDLDPTSLCLKPIATHHSVCMPDPGAPVIADDVLWGVTSGWTSEFCKIIPSPTIMTRLSLTPVRRWLDELL